MALLVSVALPGWAQAPTPLEFACASRLAYAKAWSEIEAFNADPGLLAGYALADFVEDGHLDHYVGFRALALINKEKHNVIIAYRGTEPEETANLLVDAGIFLAIGGGQAAKLAGEHLAKCGQEFGTAAQLATTMLSAALSHPKGPAAGAGATLADIQVLLASAGFDYLTGEGMQAMTAKSAERALDFYTKIHKSLLAEDTTSAGSLLDRAAIWTGYAEDPRAAQPAGYTLYVTGHSLGGFLAQTVAGRTGCPGMTFNAPGAKEYLAAAKTKLKGGGPKDFINVYRQHDVVGSFATHVGQTMVLKDFFHSPEELARLGSARAGKQAEVKGRRQALLESEQKAFEERTAAYRATFAAYQEKLVQYAEDLKTFRESYQKSWGLTLYLAEKLRGPAKPVPPPEPQPLRGWAWAERQVPDPYAGAGDDPRRVAQACYGIGGVLLRNHALAGLIEDLERAGKASAPGDAKDAVETKERKESKETKATKAAS